MAAFHCSDLHRQGSLNRNMCMREVTVWPYYSIRNGCINLHIRVGFNSYSLFHVLHAHTGYITAYMCVCEALNLLYLHALVSAVWCNVASLIPNACG